ncbi:MAG: cytochrome c biogenesis protein CcdA [Bacillota bacterium]
MIETFTQMASQALSGNLFFAIPIIFAAGVVTSLSPCILSMLPVMVGYVGGYSSSSRLKGFWMSLTFVVGLGVTFAILGILAASLNQIFGRVGNYWYLIMAVVAILMGLNLLGVFTINFPGLKTMPVKGRGLFGSFFMGLFFGLVASPCATPVLAVILTYLASQGDLVLGGVSLFFYGLGHGLPLLVAGTFTGVIKNLGSFQKYSQIITNISAIILIALGVYLIYLIF